MTAKSILSMNYTVGTRDLEGGTGNIDADIKWLEFIARTQPERAEELAHQIEALKIKREKLEAEKIAAALQPYFDDLKMDLLRLSYNPLEVLNDYYNEPPAPLDEQVAAEVSRDAHWIGTDSEPWQAEAEAEHAEWKAHQDTIDDLRQAGHPF